MYLKNYQKNAIGELLEKSKKLLGYSGSKKLVFKAPTGSGKTIMMAEFLKRLVDDREINQPLAFIWTAPRQLHIQSKEKLERYFEDTRVLKCSFFEDLDDRKIGENEILFFNWESINKVDNVYIRDNEQDLNLSKVLERTREEGREIILVIDEAHHHATSEISQKLVSDINPKLTIEVSATPAITDEDEKVRIDLEDVKVEGMIKKAVILNEGFNNIKESEKIKSGLGKGSEDLIIGCALKKREELLKSYKREGVKVNPLVLIQLPDRIGGLEDRMKEGIIGILKNTSHISTENGKLAVWLSGEHINKENVERADSEVAVLIFKQAIALGWDCPRAQILILFREWHSQIFSIQTVGRIMRMPEPDHGYYGEELLNYGYVFTNLDSVEIHEDLAKDYITVYTSKRRADYEPINLLSCYRIRYREKTRLSTKFIEIFLRESDKYDLKRKLDIKSKNPNLKLISDWKAEDIDKLSSANIIGDKAVTASSLDLQRLLDFFVRQHLTPFYPEDRSVGRVKESIYKFFKRNFDMDYLDKGDEIIQIILSEKNSQYFVNILDISKGIYQNDVVKEESELEYTNDWNIPESINYGSRYERQDKKKSIMQPFFIDTNWKTESAFINFLERSPNVDWWFKNGEGDSKYFAVPYTDGELKPFYIDFLVKMKDGRLGLFDTKSGITRKIAGPKVDGLRGYIKNLKRNGEVFGGIVTNTDGSNYGGRWVYFDGDIINLQNNNLDKWKTLEL